MLYLETIVTGPLSTNSYVVWTETETGEKPCWLFDVSIWADNLLNFLRENNLKPEKIFVTHGHGDHIGGVKEVVAEYPDIEFCCPEKDLPMLADPDLNLSGFFMLHLTAPEPKHAINPGDEFQLGNYNWKTLDTAGHTLGGVSFYCPEDHIVLTGDALFNRSIGRTDIPNGCTDTLVANIKANLLTLDEDTIVYPGHGEHSTIGEEKSFNPYMR